MHRSTIYMLLLAVYLITEISATETVDHSEAKDCVESCTEKCEPCTAPNTCDAETEIECGEEASTKGTFCSPHKICASKTCECPSTGTDNIKCPDRCTVTCTEEELFCDGQTNSQGCKEPDQCVAKGVDPEGVACPGVCPSSCTGDHIQCQTPDDERGCAQAPSCKEIEKGTDGADCPGLCPKVCAESELLCVGGNDANACKEEDTCVHKGVNKDDLPCPGSCPVECTAEQILCVGPTMADGCKVADVCRPRATDSNGEYCAATSASHECPVVCPDTEYLCPGIENNLGCKGADECVAKATDNSDPPAFCPATSVCHVPCKVNEVSCSAGTTETGCKKPDVCLPRERDYNGELCPLHCPMDCTENQIKCDGLLDNDGCQEPDFCVAKMDIPAQEPAKEGKCPAYCPATCNANQIKCPSQLDCDLCPTEEVCRIPAKNVNGENCNDNSASHNCPKICDEANNFVLCPAFEDNLGCMGEELCMKRVTYGDPEDNNYCPSYSVCPHQCKSTQIMCPDGVDSNGCKNEDRCIDKGEDLDKNPCEISCPPVCTEDQVLCEGHIKGNGCKAPDTCIAKVLGTGDGAYCKPQCPLACTAAQTYVPGENDANGCPLDGICADNKAFGAWTNVAACEGEAANPHCGPGTQSQTRTCTDGTIDKCTAEDTARVVSCAIAGTELPVCDCTCSDYLNANGWGDCKKESETFDYQYMCYVNNPETSTCLDLLESGTDPGKMRSAEACVYENSADWIPVMQIIKDSTFGFSSAYWTNNQLLNEDSAITAEVNAKYAAYLTEPFHAIRMCVGSPASNCISFTFDDEWDSAKALFSAGYIREAGISKKNILRVYGPTDGTYQDCGMQRPGFNIECDSANKARWGYCNNCATQNCQEADDDDADSSIGIGLAGQDTANEMGAGWTEYFASGSCSSSDDSFTNKRVWVSVRRLEATCTDGIQNQDETGVDCGGATCPACPSCSDGILNQDETAIDCGGVCPACPTCTDGVQNQDETGVDCGGATCDACEAAATCTDGIQNQDETGVDCGGATCDACVSCSDGIQNQDETGVDCGGATCAACPSCSDGIQNQDETGVDCGGATCDACVANFEVTLNAAIDGHNTETMEGTLEECKAACSLPTKDWCKSFDFYKTENKCDLSDKNKDDEGVVLKTDWENNPFDHYEKV